MMSVCGIGWVVASELPVRIGDWRELKTFGVPEDACVGS
jgi:hypothetical protein